MIPSAYTTRQRRRRLHALLTKTVAEEECIVWTGSIGNHGYGQYRTEDGNPTVHRMMWETFIGEIPDGYEVHHVCGNRRCVNPYHLETLSKHDHWALGNSQSALRARATHCQHGHEFTPANTYVRANGQRRCRRCHREGEYQRRHA